MNGLLNDIQTHAIPLNEFNGKWLFTNVGEHLSDEHADQIFVLNTEFSTYIQSISFPSEAIGIFMFDKEPTTQYFKSTLIFDNGNNKDVKKQLHNLPIPFNYFVLLHIDGLENVICLTWKMVIKYSANLFLGNDVMAWDHSYNWQLFYYHNDKFAFCKDYQYDAQAKQLEILEILNKYKKA